MPLRKLYTSFLKVMSGTIISQLLYFLFLPIISRSYTTNDIGVYGSILSVVTILSITLSMKMELTIVEFKEEINKAVQSTILLIFVVFFVTAPIFIAILVAYFKVSLLTSLLALLSAVFVALFQVLSSICLSLEKYKAIAANNIFRVIFCLVIQYGLFYKYGSNVNFLLIGYGVSFGLPLVFFIFIKSEIKIKKNNFNELKVFLLENIKDIKFAGGQSIVNSLSQSVPYIILPIYFKAEFLALYFIADKVFRAPLLLIGNPIRQVFLKFCNDNDDNYRICLAYKKIITIVLLPSIIVTASLYFYGGELFSLVFGKQYYASGEISLWLSIWGAIALMSFPALSFIRIKRENKFLFYNEITFLLVKLVSLILVSFIFEDGKIAIIAYSFTSIAMSLNIIRKAFLMMK